MALKYYNKNWIKKLVLGVKRLNVLPENEPILPCDSTAHEGTLFFSGSGYYHSLTLSLNNELFQSGVKHDLILFDQHSDYQKVYDFSAKNIGCANWTAFYNHHFKNSRILIAGLGYGEVGNKFPDNITVLGRNMDSLENKLDLISKKVYVSYDLDVITYDTYGKCYGPDISNSEYWARHGDDKVTLKDVLEATNKIIKNKDVVGVDICGHRPEFPTTLLGWPGTLIMMALIINQYTKNTRDEELIKYFDKDDSWCSFEKWHNIKGLIKKNKIINNAVNLQEAVRQLTK
ncbi:Uncharacterised protein [Candidatus Tiddalikarchaeum anstoanum]|nr:Uncharacterised protein [Candidatus Tiddalikarchaeum anstoanum]